MKFEEKIFEGNSYSVLKLSTDAKFVVKSLHKKEGNSYTFEGKTLDQYEIPEIQDYQFVGAINGTTYDDSKTPDTIVAVDGEIVSGKPQTGVNDLLISKENSIEFMDLLEVGQSINDNAKSALGGAFFDFRSVVDSGAPANAIELSGDSKYFTLEPYPHVAHQGGTPESPYERASYNSYRGASVRTMIGLDNMKVFYIFSFPDKTITGAQIHRLANEYNLTDLINLDGGMSVQYLDEKKNRHGKKSGVPNGLFIYERKYEFNSLELSLPRDTILHERNDNKSREVTSGEKVEILRITNEVESGDKRWAIVKYQSKEYEMVYDYTSMHPTGIMAVNLQGAVMQGIINSKSIDLYDLNKELVGKIQKNNMFRIYEFRQATSDGKYWACVGTDKSNEFSRNGYVLLNNDVIYCTGGQRATISSGKTLHSKRKPSAARSLSFMEIFDKAVGGKLIETIVEGGIAWIQGIFKEKESNGYYWMKAKNIATGYSIFNPNSTPLIGEPTGTMKMLLFGSAARIRTYPVFGKVLTIVENGNEFEVLDFLMGEAEDNYQWMKVQYNGITGYAQYDPAVMRPYSLEGNAGGGEDPDLDSSLCVILKSSSARIRDAAVKGNILETVPQGNKLYVDAIYDEVSSDGFHWMKTHNDSTGYSQMDLNVMTLVGKPANGSVKMRLTGSPAYIRSSVVNGSVLYKVSKHATFDVREFLSKVESDGYRWMKVSYKIAGISEITGYAQFDPEVMVPYTLLGKPSETGGTDQDVQNPSKQYFSMRLSGSGAYIRDGAVIGSVLETVGDGGKLYVDELFKDKNSDRYQWMKTHNNKVGYSQFDPQNMMPMGKPIPGKTIYCKLIGDNVSIYYSIHGSSVGSIKTGETFEVLDFLSTADSTGSRWMQVSYTNSIGCILGYTKYIAQDMLIYTLVGKPLETSSDAEEAQKSSNLTIHMKLFGSAARIRESAVNGNVLTTIAKGENLWVDDIYKETASDGYHWMKTHGLSQKGYSQMDLNVMYPVGCASINQKLYVKLFGSALNLHKNVVNGRIIKQISNGEVIEILDFLPNLANDGYRWMKVKYAEDAYAQFDPKVMYVFTVEGGAEENSPVDNDAQASSGQGLHMVLSGSAARIRDSAVSGNVLETVAKGETLWVNQIYLEASSDGYQWMQSYKTKQGYSQYDKNVMYPVGEPSGLTYVKLISSDARIRNKIRGTVLRTISKGNAIQVLDFLPRIASDNYRWMKVKHTDSTGTIEGYAQYDPNVMVPYTTASKPNEDNPADNEAQASSGQSLHMQLQGSAARIRTSAVIGSVVETLSDGSKLWVDDLYFIVNSDGYRWMKTHNSKSGYSQYDRNVMYPVGKPNKTTIIQLSGSAMRIRSSVRGEIIATVNDGGTVAVLDFLPNIASDGYRWMKVNYLDQERYAQFDPAVMFPFSNGGKADETPAASVKMVLTGSAARIRNDVQGAALVTVPNGSEITVQDFYDWKASDSYRWCWGSYNGISGAFQYDATVMHPVGAGNNVYMQLSGTAARLRGSVQGTVLTTAPIYSEIYIMEFLSTKASDGYYWCRGNYNGTVGYFQYDPAVMFPHGTV